jgi:hypothetical protein
MRHNPRQLDIPIQVVGESPADLAMSLNRLANVVSDRCRLTVEDSSGVRWFADVTRTGAMDAPLGAAIYETFAKGFILSLQAEEACWQSEALSRVTIGGTVGDGVPFLSKFGNIPLAANSLAGGLTLVNTGMAPTPLRWEFIGPLEDVSVYSDDAVVTAGHEIVSGGGFRWTGTVAAGDTVVFDGAAGTVTGSGGENMYTGLAPAPRFPSLPVGVTRPTVVVSGSNDSTALACSWHTRQWVVL